VSLVIRVRDRNFLSVGSSNYQGSIGPQHLRDVFYELVVLLDVLDDLYRYHGVDGARRQTCAGHVVYEISIDIASPLLNPAHNSVGGPQIEPLLKLCCSGHVCYPDLAGKSHGVV
jgi:hypothetical protein